MNNNKPLFLDLFKLSWYKEQMSNWSKISYMLLAFGIGFLIANTLSNPITSLAVITLIAAILGFTTTLAITNAKPLNGVLGFISSSIYIIVALIAKNPSDAILQGIYILLLDIPILIIPSWAKNVSSRVRLISEVKSRNEKFSSTFWYVLFTIVFFVSWFCLYFFEIKITHSPRPIIDSGTAAIGITGALLTTFRFSDSYFFWFAQGFAQIRQWGLTYLPGDSSLILFFTYILYLLNDIIGITASPWFKKNLR